MSIPVPPDTCCVESASVNIPGAAGADGDDGAAGAAGKNAYTVLTSGFTMPAEGGTVGAVQVLDSGWMTVLQGAVPGQIVIVQFAGHMQVTAKASATSITLKNLRDTAAGLYLTNAAPGTIIPPGVNISPAGLQGPTGSVAAGALLSANNLSDVANAATARGNLGLGDAAQHADSEYMDSVGAAVVDNRIIRFNGVSGKVPQESLMALTDSGDLQHGTGNARGTNAVDLQSQRAAVTQVASGAKSAVGGGENNTASGPNATIPGGKSNVASGPSAVAEGEGCLAQGPFSRAAGQSAAAYVHGQESYSGGQFASLGDCTRFNISMRRATSDATPAELFLDGASLRLNIGTGGTWVYDIIVVGRRDNGDSAVWQYKGGIKSISNVVTDVGLGAVGGLVVGAADAGCSGTWGQTANVAVAADNTNDTLKITVTGAAANNIRWHAAVRIAGVEFA